MHKSSGKRSKSIKKSSTGNILKYREKTKRLDRLFLPAILTLAFMLRLAALLDLKKSIYFTYLLWDEKIYHDWAVQIANGTYMPTSAYYFSPLPAYLMAFVYKLFSADIIYIRIMNMLLGVFICYIVYTIAKELEGRGAGLLACLTACIYKPFIFYSIVPLKTTQSVLFFALISCLAIASMNASSAALIFLTGVCTGLLINIRENCIILILPLICFILWNDYKKNLLKRFIKISFLYFLGCFLAASPFIIRNYIVSGDLVPVTTQAGMSLYLGNNLSNPDPYYRPVSFASPSPLKQSIQFNIEASRRTGKKLTPAEASSFWTGETFKIISENPEEFIKKLAMKILALFNHFEAGDHYDIGFMSNFVKFFKFPFPGFGCMLPLGMAGMIFAQKSKKHYCLICIYCLYAVTLITGFTNDRYRLPLLTILVPFAMIGCTQAISCIKIKNYAWLFAYFVAIVIIIVVEFLPVKATDDKSAYYNTHAIVLNSKGFKDEARKYWEISSNMNKPFSAFANLSLAMNYITSGNYQVAMSYLGRIPDSSFAASDKYKLIGDIHMLKHEPQQAALSYEASLGINSGDIDARKKLIFVLEKLDKQKVERESEKLKYISSFYSKF